MVTLGQLDSQFTRLKTDLAAAFAPDVVNGMKAFGTWIENNHGNIIGFFDEAGKTAKRFTEAVGGAENALKLLAAAYVGSKVTGGAVPPWLAGLVAYGTYLYNDQNNIKDSAESSLSYTKRNVGDVLRALGIDTDLGRKPGYVSGTNAQSDIPGSSIRLTDDNLMDAIRKVESSDGKHLYSPAGAVGEYQLMAPTARELGLVVGTDTDERLDPQKSRAAASIYISQLMKRYKGNTDDALMAYNWGMGNVDQWIGQGRGAGFTDAKGAWNPVPKETREYPGKIRSALGIASNDTLSYYQRQQSLSTMPRSSASNVDNSKTSSTHINTVVVNSNPQTVDALNKSITQQANRASTNAAFSSAVVP